MEIRNPYTISSDKNCEANKNDSDLIVRTIGAFGYWQAIVCILASLSRLIPIWNLTAYVFIAPAVSYKCINFNNITEIENEFESKPKVCYNNCQKYEYDNTGIQNNLLSEFNLICKDNWKASLTQTVLLFGLLVGATVFGWISDRYGRRKGLLAAITLNTLFAIGVSFTHNYWLFNFLRFFIGIASGGILVISVVIVMEVVGSKYREIAGCLLFIIDPIAECSMALIALLNDNWNVFLFSVAILSSLFMLYVFVMPETPRWLIVNGAIDDATKSMTKAAEWNKLPTVHIRRHIEESVMQINKISNKSNNNKVFNRDLITKMCYTWLIWFTIGLCYSGISQYVTFIGKNIYITVLISGLIQLPTTFASVLLNKHFGRKSTLIMTFTLNTASMATLTLLISKQSLSSILGFSSMFTLSITYTTIYLFTSELFPTSVRNMTLGVNTGGARLGAMAAPFVARMESSWLPSVMFATLSVIAIIPCLLLPETKDRELKDSVEE